jgi:hypothetical protein
MVGVDTAVGVVALVGVFVAFIATVGVAVAVAACWFDWL